LRKEDAKTGKPGRETGPRVGVGGATFTAKVSALASASSSTSARDGARSTRTGVGTLLGDANPAVATHVVSPVDEVLEAFQESGSTADVKLDGTAAAAEKAAGAGGRAGAAAGGDEPTYPGGFSQDVVPRRWFM
jgi:hypothetical protein